MKKTYITPTLIFTEFESIGKSHLVGLDTTESENNLQSIFGMLAQKSNNPEEITSIAASSNLDVDSEQYLYLQAEQLEHNNTNAYTR